MTTKNNSAQKENIRKVRNFLRRAWSKGDLRAVEEFYHPKAKHGANFSFENYKMNIESTREVFPDFKVVIKDILAFDDKVVCEVEYTGTHTGKSFFGQEPLGKKISVPGMDLYSFRNGNCIKHQHAADHLDLVQQIGLMLVPASGKKNERSA